MFDSALDRCQQVEINTVDVRLLTGIVSYAQDLNSSFPNSEIDVGVNCGKDTVPLHTQ